MCLEMTFMDLLDKGDESKMPSLVTTSLWCTRDKTAMRANRRSCMYLLLLLCGDIERCPGPNATNLNDFTKLRGFSIFHQNRGLLGNFAEFEILIKSNNFDIITLSEIHISNNGFNDIDNLYTIDGYEFIRRNRISGGGGGVAMYIKSGINFKHRSDLENKHLESLWVEICLPHTKSFLVASFYRPLIGSKYLSNNFNDMFANCLNGIKKETIILGDFNVNYLETDNNAIHSEFKSILTLHGFWQMITKATRITDTTKTLIDLIATNEPTLITHSNVFATSISDHDMVGCIRKKNTAKFAPRTVTARDYKNYDNNNLLDLSVDGKRSFPTNVNNTPANLVSWTEVEHAHNQSVHKRPLSQRELEIVKKRQKVDELNHEIRQLEVTETQQGIQDAEGQLKQFNRELGARKTHKKNLDAQLLTTNAAIGELTTRKSSVQQTLRELKTKMRKLSENKAQ